MSKLDQTSLERLTEDSDLYIRYISKRIKDHNLAEDYFHDALSESRNERRGTERKKKNYDLGSTEY